MVSGPPGRYLRGNVPGCVGDLRPHTPDDGHGEAIQRVPTQRVGVEGMWAVPGRGYRQGTRRGRSGRSGDANRRDGKNVRYFENRRLDELPEEIQDRDGWTREKNDYWERGYRDGYYKKAAPGLEIARVLLGDHLNERDREPSRAESRLYKFLQINEQEMVEAGVLQHIAEDDDEDGQQGRKGKRKGRRRNKGKGRSMKRETCTEHSASRYAKEPAAWVNFDKLAQSMGATKFRVHKYMRYVDIAASEVLDI